MERRKGAGQRVHFEAMVAVGGAEGGAAFEAESIDLSSEGMRLRAAYLPAVGDQLVCRFEGPEGEVVAIGEVTWATELQKGGDFGLRFVDLDDETAAALKQICLVDSGDESGPEEPQSPKVQKGARVKLHIEGLASPMKARVRDTDGKIASVGSSLEFLKLGRQVEVEDVDLGDRREGFVDGVKVEVDPATSIPQLVVSLRFDGLSVGKSAAKPEPREKIVAERSEEEAAPATQVAGTKKPAKAVDEPKKRESIRPAPPAEASPAVDADAEEEDDLLPPNKLRAAQERAKVLTVKAASSIGPAFTKMGQGAKGFLSRLKSSVDKKREERAEAKKNAQPKRVTAPPPSGALTSDGRRLVRGEKDGDGDDAPIETPKRSRKNLVVGAAAGLALVLGIVGVSKALSGGGDAPKPALVAADGQPAKKELPALPPIPGSPATADVPLYGQTPMTTTEQVPATPAASAKTAAQDAEPSEEGDEAQGAESAELKREWGQGELKNAKTLKIKMDGPIEGFSASEAEDGFTIVVPKHKSASTSSTLVHKDKRLSAVDVVNREEGAEITVKFKGDVPAYKAKVRGDRIEIALGGEGGSKKSDEKKKVAAKKPDAKKKKPAGKKK